MSGFSELVSEIGGAPRLLAAAAGLHVDDFGQHERYIPLRNGIALLEETAAVLDTPDLGRRLATRQSIDILGAVGLAARSARSVGEAFAVIARFMSAYSPMISAEMNPTVDPSLHRFEFRYTMPGPPPQSQAIELSLGVSIGVLRLFLGRDYRPVSVHIPHPPNGPVEDYRRYFGGPTSFSEPVAAITVCTVDLERTLPVDPLAHRIAVEYLTASAAEAPVTTTHTVLTLLRMLLPTGAVGIVDVAAYIGVHPKTLQRRLAAEGATFTDLVDDVRRGAAQRLLLDTDLGFDLVCRQVGYAEQSVLTRSCRRWFGMTPSLYRRLGVR